MAGSFRLDLTEFQAKLAILKRPHTPIVRALNRSINSGKTAVIRAIGEETGLKRSDIVPFIRVQEAAQNRLSAAVFASAKRVPLIKFGARGPEPSRGRGRGVTAKLKGGAGRYPKFFIAIMPTGHKGVFERKAGVKRLPIQEKFGPSLWGAFQKHQPAALARAQEQLVKNLAHEIEFALSSGR